jgi:hypothetical protein
LTELAPSLKDAVAGRREPPFMPHLPFDLQQQATAAWLGCTVDEMNRMHDQLHIDLCHAFGLDSYSLQPLAECDRQETRRLAELEERAVMHVQRWLIASRKARS